jgi:hypothetical protein
MGVVLILSGIVAVVLAAITTPWVATAGLALVPSGVWLVVLSEYRDEAELDSTRFGGLKVRVRKDPRSTNVTPTSSAKSQPPVSRSASAGRLQSLDEEGAEVNDSPLLGSTRRGRLARCPPAGCRLARALNRRWEGGR